MHISTIEQKRRDCECSDPNRTRKVVEPERGTEQQENGTLPMGYKNVGKLKQPEFSSSVTARRVFSLCTVTKRSANTPLIHAYTFAHRR